MPEMITRCPPGDEFKQAALDVASGAALGDWSHRRLVWCVGEAIKQQDRQALTSACTMAFVRDERTGKLAVRYKAVDADLAESSGTLGQERDFGARATNITAATHTTIARM